MGGYIGGPPLKKKNDPGKIPGTQTTLSPNPGKKCGFSPRRMVQRGEIPHFFLKIGDSMVWLPGILLKNWSKQGVPPF